MKPNSPTATRVPAGIWRLAAAALAGLLLAWQAKRYDSFLADDALISLQYTKRLLAGDGLTWCEGNLVEGYSNFLWVMLCAVPGLLGIDLIDGVRGLSFLGMGSAVVALTWAGDSPRRWTWLSAPVFFALAGPVAVWTFGGLEVPLLAGLLAWMLVVAFPLFADESPTRRRVLGCSVLLGLLALTRPDGPIFTVALVVALMLTKGWRRTTRRLALQLASLPVLAVVGQTVFRLLYYGEWLPNTALVKIGPTGQRLAEGVTYLGAGLAAVLELSLLAGLLLAATWRLRVRRGPATLLVVCFLAWSGYVVFIGGDVFEGFRHHVPLIVILSLALSVGLQNLAETLTPVRRRRILLAVLLLGAAVFGWRQNHQPDVISAANNRFVWYGQDIATTLKQAFGHRDPLCAVSAAGCFPYWTDFRCLDMLGLNDHHIARARPEGFGTGPLAHELGDAAYVLDRKPDLMFIGAPGPGSGRQLGGQYDNELLDDPRFRRNYRLVRLGIGGAEPFSCYVWMRLTSPRIGWKLTRDRATIPTYFFNGYAETRATLMATGRLGITVGPDMPAYLRVDDQLHREIVAVETVPPARGISVGYVRNNDGSNWLGMESSQSVWLEQLILHFAGSSSDLTP